MSGLLISVVSALCLDANRPRVVATPQFYQLLTSDTLVRIQECFLGSSQGIHLKECDYLG